MDAFARALEAIPSTLISNSGNDQLDRLLELRSQHRQGSNSNYGVSEAGLCEAIDQAWSSAETISHALQAAHAKQLVAYSGLTKLFQRGD